MSKVTQLARNEARMRVQAHQAGNTIQCIVQGRVYWTEAQVCHRQSAPLCLCVPGGSLGPPGLGMQALLVGLSELTRWHFTRGVCMTTNSTFS